MIENRVQISNKRLEKMTCECGSSVCHGDISRHKKSKKLIDFMTNLQDHSFSQ